MQLVGNIFARFNPFNYDRSPPSAFSTDYWPSIIRNRGREAFFNWIFRRIAVTFYRIALVHLCIHLFASGDNARIMCFRRFFSAAGRDRRLTKRKPASPLSWPNTWEHFHYTFATFYYYSCYSTSPTIIASPVHLYRLPLSFDGIEGRHLPTSFCFYQKEYRSGKSSYD